MRKFDKQQILANMTSKGLLYGTADDSLYPYEEAQSNRDVDVFLTMRAIQLACFLGLDKEKPYVRLDH